MHPPCVTSPPFSDTAPQLTHTQTVPSAPDHTSASLLDTSIRMVHRYLKLNQTNSELLSRL